MKAGKIRFEYHHFIVVDGNLGSNESRRSAEASECAKEQGKFWEYHDYLFQHQNGEGQGAFSDPNLKAFAVTLALDATKFNACLEGGTYSKAVAQDEALARSLGTNQTPTLYVNGKPLSDPLNETELRTAIETALAK